MLSSLHDAKLGWPRISAHLRTRKTSFERVQTINVEQQDPTEIESAKLAGAGLSA